LMWIAAFNVPTSRHPSVVDALLAQNVARINVSGATRHLPRA
jgi:hypothetical protein